MTGLVLVTGMVLVVTGLHKADCMVYHVAFLGRTSSLSEGEKVGELHYQGTSSTPTVSNEVGCIWEAEGNTDIKRLVPNGTCLGLIPDRVGISSSGFKVESADDFILHVYQSDPNGTLADGYLAIPDEHLGTEYYVITYCSLGGFCQFAVAGTVDETSVNIVFPREVSPAALTCNGVSLPDNAPPGEPIAFHLNENQVLHIESSDSKTDLSGTYISSDHEVAVFVGARDVPSANGSEAYMIEQIPPINKWGTDFVVAPNVLNDAGDVIKIVTQSVETTVHILAFSPFTISNPGESVERRIDWQMHSTIHASKPILIVQVMSLDLYNDTAIVTGSPAMVLVPHVEQWTDIDLYSDCLQKAAVKQSILTVVAETDSRLSLAWSPAEYSSYGQWQLIKGSDYSVFTAKTGSPQTEEGMSVAGVNRSLYGYCDGKSAVLLAANWDWENEGCIRTPVVPGDGVDNDCDGKIDEDICTKNDLDIKFTSTQNANTGETTFKSINVKGASPVNVRVTSCDIVVITLQSADEPIKSYTAIVTPLNVMLEVCAPDCTEIGTIPTDPSFCTSQQTYTIAWSSDDDESTTVISFELVRSDTVSPYTIPDIVDFDLMFVTAFSQTADFVIELPEKDCGKIKSGEDADNFGLIFVVQVGIGDSYSIFLTNANAQPVNVTLHFDQGSTVEKIVGPNEVETVMKDDLSSSTTVITIVATNEISVYALRMLPSQHMIGHPVLPFDILGPNYHLFLDSALADDAAADSELLCAGFAITDDTETNVGPVPIKITKEMYKNELGHQKLLTATSPIAMFCGGSDSVGQMPPRETLGKQHYIPPLNLTIMEAVGEIKLVATEDSTVVIIRGNYDNLDTVELTGNIFTRAVVTNTLYNISSTKPIQVHLHLRSILSKATSWESVVVIPPVEQYKSEHVFSRGTLFIGGLQFLDHKYSAAVNEMGELVTSKVMPSSTGPILERLSYDNKTFSLTFLATHESVIRLIVTSDVMYNDINKVCKITPGTPGDGVDNDCDGLIDEEQCTAAIEPGEIDVDIDGDLNEDCANGTTQASLSVINLSLTPTTITCPTNQGSEIDNGNAGSENGGRVTIDNGIPNADTDPPTEHPNKAAPPGVGPSYPPIASTSTGGAITIPGSPATTSAPNSSSTAAAEVETCTADCVCPCGWVEIPKNYTKEELKAVVTEIQEKLKVSKISLSSTIRSKTSAKDGRAEAAAVGIVGVVFLATMFCAIILLDITTIVRDVRVMVGNLRQVFQP